MNKRDLFQRCPLLLATAFIPLVSAVVATADGTMLSLSHSTNASEVILEFGVTNSASYSIEHAAVLPHFTTIETVTGDGDSVMRTYNTATTTDGFYRVTETLSTFPALPNGIVMRDIPAGSFTMGDASFVGPLANDHKPERMVNISAFRMSDAEITVQQYVDFLNVAIRDEIIIVDTGVPSGTYVFGAPGQTFAGHKLIDLTGSRVLKDHDNDGDIDPENPLNQCWIAYDPGTTNFTIRDPASIDWDGFPYEEDVEGTSDETRANWPELAEGALPTVSEIASWPVTFIKWYGAKVFADYYGCDLPTEAQWEYAAKGGQSNAYATADGLIDATRVNYNENNAHPDTGHVVPVRSYAPNPFGLYDLSGNVWEWCRDWYDPAFYASRPDPDTNPYNTQLVIGTTEPLESPTYTGGPGQAYNGDTRVKRGGSWNFHQTANASAARERDYTWRGNDHFGFRIVAD